MYSNDYGMLYLDIRYGDGERVRSSTKLKDTSKNRKLLENNIIPKIEVQILNGEYNPNAKQVVVPDTVKEYGYRSLKRHQNKRREHVQASYLRHFEMKIVPYFGNMLIREISPIQLMDWQNELMETEKAFSVKKYRTVFNGIFEDAYKERVNGKRMISINPFREVDVPKAREIFIDGDEESLVDGDINPFSLEEIEQLLSKADGYLKNFIGIMSRTGMRPGELTALRWSDIDFDNEIIKVRRTRILGKNGPPKKKASVRDVEMLSGVKEFFQDQYKLTGNNLIGDVFINSNHKPFYSHDVIAKQFKALLGDEDKRYLYQLRHSFATMMISEGEDILWVSRMLGHKSSDITLKTYAKAYNISHNKNERKQRALFLEKGHSLGTVDNLSPNNALK
jgi:integrase